jgi:hypothetical protein
MLRHILGALCFGLLLATTPVFADHGAPAAIAFRDSASDAIKSDGKTGLDGSVEYMEGVEGVRLVVDGLGYVSMNLRYARPPSYSRYVYYDFTNTVDVGADGSPSPKHDPPLLQGMPWRTDFEAMPQGVPGGLWGMEVGATAPCAASFYVYPMYLHQEWWVEFDHGAYPGSSYVTATRLDATSWAIEASSADIAVVVEPRRNGSPPAMNCGYYSMPFRMVVRLM